MHFIKTVKFDRTFCSNGGDKNTLRKYMSKSLGKQSLGRLRQCYDVRKHVVTVKSWLRLYSKTELILLNICVPLPKG
jgi:hypothetical protein